MDAIVYNAMISTCEKGGGVSSTQVRPFTKYKWLYQTVYFQGTIPSIGGLLVLIEGGSEFKLLATRIDEKVGLAKAAGAEPSGQHAVAAGRTSASEKAQDTSCSDHFWKLRY